MCLSLPEENAVDYVMFDFNIDPAVSQEFYTHRDK